MEDIFKSIEVSIKNNNPYAALCVSLTLPDIVAAYEYPTLAGRGNVANRYRKWFNEHRASEYVHEVGATHDMHEFMNADDFYAMRCAVLHEGKDDVSSNSLAVLSKFEFVTLPSGGVIHCNSSQNGAEIRLNIQVEILSKQIIEKAREWWDNLGDSERNRIDGGLIVIRSF